VTLINEAYRELAKEFDVALVDYEALTNSRFDEAHDSTHYVCGECNHHFCPVSGGKGSDITQAAVQMFVRIIQGMNISRPTL
jgi:hypothetical protein